MSTPMTAPTNRARQEATLARLDRFSRITDTAIQIPFTRIRFGLDPVIGLVPVLGDLAGLILSLYVLVEAQQVGASRQLKAQMIRNMLIEFFGGMVPIVGDAFDVVYRANTRNTRLLRRYLEEQLAIEQPRSFPWKQFILVTAGLVLLTALILALLL